LKKSAGEIPIAHRAYRLRTLQRIATKAEGMRNMAMVLQVLEQAAKEVGDAYVNRRMEPVKPATASTQIPEQAEYVLAPDEPAPGNPVL